MREKRAVIQNQSMPMIALRGLVLFPKMVLHFDIGRDKSIAALNAAVDGSRRIFLTAQRELNEDNPGPEGLYSVGVIAEVKQIVRIPGSGMRVMAEGVTRAKMLSVSQQDPYFQVEVRPIPMRRIPRGNEELISAIMRTVKNLFDEYAALSPKMPKELTLGAMAAEDPNTLAEFIAGNIPLPLEEKQEILEESSVVRRLEILADILENENDILSLERDIYEKVKQNVDKNQRDYYLREQIKVLSEELGDEESPEGEAESYLEKIEAAELPEEARTKLVKEVRRLSRLSGSSQEAGVIRGYLDTCLELPWSKTTAVRSDTKEAERILDRDHYGLTKVKERIVESIAVRSLAPDMRGQILCLVGPPGVGKTSIAKSIAKATGREYVRLSLGGVRDESDIRGHRKTYVGSMPGRIIDAMRRVKTKNPLMLLDEVDKLGSDFKGDPSSALLEVLDAEQNMAFRDHFIELPFDLSQVLFVATANVADNIPAPLYDRMEVIELSSYTREEKFQIAKRHLVPKQRSRHGLTGQQVRLSDDALYALIDGYTREAGVRTLERQISSIFRKCAKRVVEGESRRITVSASALEGMLGPKKHIQDRLLQNDEVGVANGLAWTSVGGEMLQIEVAVLEGSGKLELTGKLGDVMKESAHAAVSYIRSRCELYGVEPDFHKTKDIHIHVPEGAVPKDGPSAGITICTALLSALTQIPVRRDVAMTGEITLRGRVLPIGGLKEKTMAAYRIGIKTVIIPSDNEPDLAEVDPVVKEAIRFVPAHQIDTVLSTALASQPMPRIGQDAAMVSIAPEYRKRSPVTC